MTSGDNRRKAFALLLLLLAITSSRCDETAKGDPLVIQTSKGAVKGATLKALDKEMDAFLGIPYAKPPLGELRFRPPQPADPWSGVLDATKPPNTCFQGKLVWFEDEEMKKTLQPSTPLSEDCLTLNVWIPRPRPKDAAVMVWIHGGAFVSGSPNFQAYDPRILCAEEQVIVVAIAYRVASLGFLYLDRPDVPGNAGMLDQTMALQWIRDNIRNFGGDPNSVTIFGHSAGAASVSYHLLSPLSRDLFTRGIVQSGSVLAPWSSMDNSLAKRNALKLAERLGCPHNSADTGAVVACLRTKDASEILHTEDTMNGFMNFISFPTIDGKFFPIHAEDILTLKQFKKNEILVGFTSGDGNIFVPPALPGYFDLKQEVRLTRQQFMDSIKRLTPGYSELVHDAIIYEYTDWNDPDNTTTSRNALGELLGDDNFICPTINFARWFADAGIDVYMYIFTQIPSVRGYPEWMGALHGYEIPFWFGQALYPERGFTEEEKKFARRIMRYWANFARTGNPNRGPDVSDEPIVWPLHTAEDLQYLTLSAENNEWVKNYKARKCAFWGRYVPNLKHHTSRSTKKCSTAEEAKRGYLIEVAIAVAVAFFIFRKRV